MTLSIGALPGTFVGAWLTQIIPSKSYRMIWKELLIILGIFLLAKKEATTVLKSDTNEKDNVALKKIQKEDVKGTKKTIIRLLVTGVLLGVVCSFFGIGEAGEWCPFLFIFFIWNLGLREQHLFLHFVFIQQLVLFFIYSEDTLTGQLSFGEE